MSSPDSSGREKKDEGFPPDAALIDRIQRLLVFLVEKGFFHLLATNFFRQFLGFGTILLVARFLTPAELGNVKVIQSWAALFFIVAGFGYSSGILKFCSEVRDTTEKETILRRTLYVSSISMVATAGLVAVLAGSGKMSGTPEVPFWLAVYCFSIPFAVLTEVLNMYLLAGKRVKEMAFSITLIKVQSFAIIVASTFFAGFRGFVVATVVAYAIGLYPPFRHVGCGFLRAPSRPFPEGFNRFVIWSLLANLANTAGQMSDMILLDRLHADREGIGCYSLALIFVMGASQITAAVQAILSPYFSERSGDLSWVRKQIFLNLGRIVLLSLAVSAGVWGTAYVLVRYFYGTPYAPSLAYLPVLLLRYVFWSSSVVLAVALFGMGYVRYNFYTGAAAAVVAIPASWFLLVRVGIAGVAWGQVIYAGLVLLFLSRFLAKALSARSLAAGVA